MAILAKDLAKLIGVSTATLSLVLNGKPGISDKTRAMVEKKIIELGYKDMLQAKQETTAKSQMDSAPAHRVPITPPPTENKAISFILFKNNGQLLGINSFFPLIFDGIESQARRYGYSLNIINIEKSLIDEQLSFIANAGSAGFIIFATEMKEDMIDKFASLNLPFVIFDNYFNDRDLYCAKVNNEQGTFIAAKYLYESGHRRIGYLSSGEDINSFYERQKWALDAIEHFCGRVYPEDIITIGYPHENAEIGMDRYLDAHPNTNLPTAFLADNDLVAIGAMQSLKKHGYSLPKDCSFIGFDDRPIATLVEPKLSSIQLPRIRFGAAAVDLLVEQIESPSEDYINIEINGKLIIRDSVASLK